MQPPDAAPRPLGVDGLHPRVRLSRSDARQHRGAYRLTSPRAYFNIDWITLLVVVVIAVVGAIYFLIGRPDRKVGHHLHDELEPTGAERHG